LLSTAWLVPGVDLSMISQSN